MAADRNLEVGIKYQCPKTSGSQKNNNNKLVYIVKSIIIFTTRVLWYIGLVDGDKSVGRYCVMHGKVGNSNENHGLPNDNFWTICFNQSRW